MNPTNIIPICISGVACLIAILTFGRNGSDIHEQDVAERTIIKESLKNILDCVNEIKADIKEMRVNVNDLEKRVVVLEHDIEALKEKI